MPKARSPSPSTSPCPTPPAESQVLAGITVHIIDAKLSPSEIGEMFALAQNTGAKLSSTPQNASVLITALTMRRRLERHIPWDIAVRLKVDLTRLGILNLPLEHKKHRITAMASRLRRARQTSTLFPIRDD
jgi:hypothetical protein